jgi:UDP:flavonoid glycosyltransferase YjiC (YdhE family)
MVLIPIGADHDLNADAVARVGAAIKIDGAAATEVLCTAITRALDDSTFRAAACRLRDEIAEMPEPAPVTHVLEQLAGC